MDSNHPFALDGSPNKTNDTTTNKIFSFLPTDEFTSALQGNTTRWNDVSEPKVTPQQDVSLVKNDGPKLGSILRMTDILNQHILLHPFIALRRTCQVNRKCSPFVCVQPFSHISFLYHQQRNQGISALYKGLSSELLVKGITMGTETAIANYFDWPTDIRSKKYIEDSMKIITLRALSVALSTPFLCSSVVETVQSVIVFRERPSFVDCLKDGFLRIIHLGSSTSARMIPIWLLVVPTVFYHVAHSAVLYVAKHFVRTFKSSMLSNSKSTVAVKTMRNRSIHDINFSIMDEMNNTLQHDLTMNQESTDTSIDVDNIEEDSNEISTSIIASLLADVALLPVETVLNSLYIQGTRTIIGNCDETTVVLPALTNYDGFSDCYQSILKFEGTLGLYKGLGAIALQYSLHFLLFQSLYYLLREFQHKDGGNAQKKLTSRAQKSRRSTSRMNTGNRRNIENLRHSTPNNPSAFHDRHAENEFNVNNTPSSFERL